MTVLEVELSLDGCSMGKLPEIMLNCLMMIHTINNPTMAKLRTIKKYIHKGHVPTPLTNLRIMFRKSTVSSFCSAYQRLDAKKALIGTTQVAYLPQKELCFRKKIV